MIQGKKQKLCKNFDWGAKKECYTQQFRLVIPTPKPTPVPTPVPTKPKSQMLGTFGGWKFWAVGTNSTLDPDVKAAYLATGLETPCFMYQSGYYTHGCTVVTKKPKFALSELALALGCTHGVPSCGSLVGVYVYMGERWGKKNACGVEGKRYCVRGNANKAGKALCVHKG